MTKTNSESRRKFLKLGLGIGVASVAGITGTSALLSNNNDNSNTGEKIKILTADGKLVEVDKSSVKPVLKEEYANIDESRVGLVNKKFVMVVDLAKCKNARKCIEVCQKGHHLPPLHEWMRVYMMQENEHTSPYWFPRPCFHCDNPMCVSVCPVGATYKRKDGIVLVDNERCIGCKFCMTGCPYSVRVFNWKHYPSFDSVDQPYSPETNTPGKEGTVGKCVFCADLLRKNELPRCVQGCPMGVLYFGNLVDDSISNGTETVRFSELIKQRSGYRFLEELGTLPSVYYLPAVDRQYKFESGLEDLDPEVEKRYENTPYYNKKTQES